MFAQLIKSIHVFIHILSLIDELITLRDARLGQSGGRRWVAESVREDTRRTEKKAGQVEREKERTKGSKIERASTPHRS